MPIDKGNKPPASSVLENVFEEGRSEDPDVLLQQLGTEFVNRFFMLYRTGKVHTIDNQATQQAIRNFIKALQDILEISSTASLVSVGEGFYLNKVLLRVEFSGFENFRYLKELFDTIQIAGVNFRALPVEQEITEFLQKLLQTSHDTEEKNWIGNQSFSSIGIVPLGDMEEVQRKVLSKQVLADPNYLLRLYLKTVLFLQGFIASIEKGEFSSMNLLQRTVHELIDAMGESTGPLLALVNLHSQEEYLPYHSTNVAIYSLMIGRELGLERKHMSDLGTAALLHDIGKIQIPTSILNKRIALQESDWKEIQKAHTYSLMQLIQLRGFNESALRRMLVAYEHSTDLPKKKGKAQPTLLARIVTVAHCYDAMRSPQPYRDAILPTEAFQLMRKEEGIKFDPIILEVFFRMLTPYPPGTFVELTTKELAVVVDEPKKRRKPEEPAIKILYEKDGKKSSGKRINLSQTNGKISIAMVHDPKKYQINPLIHVLPTGAKQTD